MKSIHEECSECDYEATKKGNLITHVKSVHEGVKYSCYTIRLRWEEKKMIEITYFFFINGLNLVIIWLIWYETPVICRKK